MSRYVSPRLAQAAGPMAAVVVLTVLTRPGWPLDRLDALVAAAIVRRRSPAGIRLAHLGSALGDPAAAGAAVAVAAVLARQPRRAIRAALATMAGMVVRRQLCQTVHRTRPPEAGWTVTPDGPSYPSRHTAQAVLATEAVMWLLRRPYRAPASVAIATAVGVSRVYLGVHWPTDVLAAAAYALGWQALALPAEPRSSLHVRGLRAPAGVPRTPDTSS